MLVCVVLLFLCCWGPRFVLEFLLKLRLGSFYTPFMYWFRVCVFMLPFLHAVVNPTVYFVMSKSIRTSVVKQVRLPYKKY